MPLHTKFVSVPFNLYGRILNSNMYIWLFLPKALKCYAVLWSFQGYFSSTIKFCTCYKPMAEGIVQIYLHYSWPTVYGVGFFAPITSKFFLWMYRFIGVNSRYCVFEDCIDQSYDLCGFESQKLRAQYRASATLSSDSELHTHVSILLFKDSFFDPQPHLPIFLLRSWDFFIAVEAFRDIIFV